MQKTITITVDFPDGFIPPDNFDEAKRANHWTSACEPCPFYFFEDEHNIDYCFCPSNKETCPIKKYF